MQNLLLGYDVMALNKYLQSLITLLEQIWWIPFRLSFNSEGVRELGDNFIKLNATWT